MTGGIVSAMIAIYIKSLYDRFTARIRDTSEAQVWEWQHTTGFSAEEAVAICHRIHSHAYRPTLCQMLLFLINLAGGDFHDRNTSMMQSIARKMMQENRMWRCPESDMGPRAIWDRDDVIHVLEFINICLSQLENSMGSIPTSHPILRGVPADFDCDSGWMDTADAIMAMSGASQFAHIRHHLMNIDGTLRFVNVHHHPWTSSDVYAAMCERDNDLLESEPFTRAMESIEMLGDRPFVRSQLPGTITFKIYGMPSLSVWDNLKYWLRKRWTRAVERVYVLSIK